MKRTTISWTSGLIKPGESGKMRMDHSKWFIIRYRLSNFLSNIWHRFTNFILDLIVSICISIVVIYHRIIK